MPIQPWRGRITVSTRFEAGSVDVLTDESEPEEVVVVIGSALVMEQISSVSGIEQNLGRQQESYDGQTRKQSGNRQKPKQ